MGTQVFPWQQPLQLLGLHVRATHEPVSQVRPASHGAQAPPLPPQAAVEGETQLPPWQHPSGQVVESHGIVWHDPASQN